jgi:hypothetical protein
VITTLSWQRWSRGSVEQVGEDIVETKAHGAPVAACALADRERALVLSRGR